jgi:hypothetical protein
VNEGFYILRPAEVTAQKAQALVVLLNSTLAWFWFYHQKRKGHRLQIDKDVLLAFPAPEKLRLEDISVLQNLYPANKHQETDFKRCDRLVNDLYGISKEEALFLQDWRLKQENRV